MIAAFPDAQPVAGFAGGLLIGLAAALMLLGLGRIAGVSGLAARAIGISSSGAPRAVALAFVLGIPLGAGLLGLVFDIETHFPPSFPLLIGAGLLVGYGTRLGSGCTSGHGVCGLSRLSPRSIVATLLFLTSGVVTATLIRLLGGS
jgi:uncharacterized membrane protein YedE/YeeE